MTKSLLFVLALIEKEIDVVQQELTALLHRHRARRTAGNEIRGLRENPWIAQGAATA